MASSRATSRTCLVTAALLVFAILIFFDIMNMVLSWVSRDSGPLMPCRRPTIRREWRSLSDVERQDFVKAVNCLGNVSSRWTHNGTLYDDFAYLHGSIGSWCRWSSLWAHPRLMCNDGHARTDTCNRPSLGIVLPLASMDFTSVGGHFERGVWV